MREDVRHLVKKSGIAFKNIVTWLLVGVFKIATCDTTISILKRTGVVIRSTGVRIGRAVLSTAAAAFPRARDVAVIGFVQGFRVFKAQFNRNGANSVRSVRNKLSPLDIVSVVASLAIAAFAPVIGAMLLIGTYVVFYKNADDVPLALLSTDASVESVLGIGTALVVNVFKFVGAIGAAVNWVLSQLEW